MKTFLAILALALLAGGMPVAAQNAAPFYSWKQVNTTSSASPGVWTKLNTNAQGYVASGAIIYNVGVDAVNLGVASNVVFYSIPAGTMFSVPQRTPPGKFDLGTNWWISSATATQPVRILYSVPQ